MSASVITRRFIPWGMVWVRVALAPGIVLAAHRGWNGKWLGLIILLALVDDIYDGVLARRWHCDTPALRLADSLADTVFYLGVTGALWLREPQVLRSNWGLLAVLFALEAGRYLFDLAKFGKAASYHSYLAKCWGLVMAIALIAVVSFGGLMWLVRASILLGILTNLEGLTMSLLLRHWQNDVKTLFAAWHLRQRQLSARHVP